MSEEVGRFPCPGLGDRLEADLKQRVTQSESTVGKSLALHLDDLSSIPRTLSDPLSLQK